MSQNLPSWLTSRISSVKSSVEFKKVGKATILALEAMNIIYPSRRLLVARRALEVILEVPSYELKYSKEFS